MSEANRVYAAPIEDRPSPVDDEPGGYWLGLRLHLAWVGVASLLSLASAGWLEYELFDPAPTSTADAYAAAHTLHGVAIWGCSLPLGMGLLSSLLLPGALGITCLRPRWLGYGSLMLWPMGTLLLLTQTNSPWGDAGVLWIGLIVSGLALIAFQVLWTLAAQRHKLTQAPLLATGVGIAAGLQLLAFAQSLLQFFGPSLGIPTFGTGLPYLIHLIVPVSLGASLHLLERHSGRPLVRPWLAAAIVLLALRPWFQFPAGDPPLAAAVWAFLANSAALVTIVFVAIAAIWRYASSEGRGHPVASGAVLVVLLTCLCVFADSLLASLSVDVHLHDTYFALAPVHLAGLTAMLVLVIASFEAWEPLLRRRPGPRLAAFGLALTAVGFGGAFVTMAALGQAGMPRRYFTYLDGFTDHHRAIGILGGVGVVGVLLVTAAFVRGRRDSPQP